MPIRYIGRWERKYENLKYKDLMSREIEVGRLEQMDNDEEKRQELAIIAYKSIRGAAREKAMVEERRRIEEYSIQRQCLFPREEKARLERPPNDKDEQRVKPEQPPNDKDEQRVRPEQPPNDKGKQRADPNIPEPPNILAPKRTKSTTPPSDESDRVPTLSSSSSPPPRQHPQIKPLPSKVDYISMSSRRYRLHSIPPWFFLDQACAAYATPVPDLKNVMELGVSHTASVML